jgi:hypothetical protein
MLETIFVVVLILVLVGALPTWGYSRAWGYGPSTVIGAILLAAVVIVLVRAL